MARLSTHSTMEHPMSGEGAPISSEYLQGFPAQCSTLSTLFLKRRRIYKGKEGQPSPLAEQCPNWVLRVRCPATEQARLSIENNNWYRLLRHRMFFRRN